MLVMVAAVVVVAAVEAVISIIPFSVSKMIPKNNKVVTTCAVVGATHLRINTKVKSGLTFSLRAGIRLSSSYTHNVDALTANC